MSYWVGSVAVDSHFHSIFKINCHIEIIKWTSQHHFSVEIWHFIQTYCKNYCMLLIQAYWGGFVILNERIVHYLINNKCLLITWKSRSNYFHHLACVSAGGPYVICKINCHQFYRNHNATVGPSASSHLNIDIWH